MVAGNSVDGWPQQVYNIVLLLYDMSSTCGPNMLVVKRDAENSWLNVSAVVLLVGRGTPSLVK